MRERKRNVDIEKVEDEKLEDLSNQIGEKVKNLVDNTILEVNKILAIYGMEAKMEVVITEKEEVKE